MTRTPLIVITLLPAIVVSSMGGVASSFVAPRTRSLANRHLTPQFAAASNSHAEEGHAVAVDKNRRYLLAIVPAATLPFLLNSDVASAASDVASAAAPVPLLENELTGLPILSPPPPEQISPAVKVTRAPPPPEQIDSATTATRAPSRDVVCADSAEENRIAIFERVAPSVVYIDTFAEKRDVFSTNVEEVPIGSGSGFIWDDSGHIVTNFHVVQQAKSAQVAILTSGSGVASVTPAYTSARPGALGSEGGSSMFKDFTRTVYKAKVIGVDPAKDIAVLKVEDVPTKELCPIQVGTSTGLRVGQGSLAIGNPFGLDHTLTTGVISGIGREVKSPTNRPITNVIQTDAAINPGNSGGPLLDSSGKMIGMATAIYSPTGASAGVGFAIPVDTVKSIVGMLIQNGQIVRPLLGVSILDSRQARQALGITKGVLILEVKPDTPAAAAGLRGIKRIDNGIIEIGDIIIAVEGTPIEKEGDLFKAMEAYEPGDVVKVTVNRQAIGVDGDGEPQIKMKELVKEVKTIASDDAALLKS